METYVSEYMKLYYRKYRNIIVKNLISMNMFDEYFN